MAAVLFYFAHPPIFKQAGKVKIEERQDRMRRTVLTTSQVARICQVAPRTVQKWFDKNFIRGYRLPASRDRRIPVEELIRFMQEYNIPLPEAFAREHIKAKERKSISVEGKKQG